MSTLHERLIAATEQPLAGLQYTTGFLKAKVDALRAVVELHAPKPLFDGASGWTGDFLVCHGCDIDGAGAERPEWPCSTIKAIASALGVEIGETP